MIVQKVKERHVAISASSEHAKYQIDIVVREVAILFEDGDVEQPLDFPTVNRTASQSFQQVCSLALFPRDREIDHSLKSELPLFVGAPFEHRTYVLVRNTGIVLKQSFSIFTLSSTNKTDSK